MEDVLTYGIEALVGVATAAIGAGLWRSGRRWVAVALVAAGLSAVVHAAVSLI